MTEQPVCAYQIPSLKKSITRKRKLENISGTKSRSALLDLLESHESYYDDMPEISDLLFGEKELEEQSTAQLRRTWTLNLLRVTRHKPVTYTPYNVSIYNSFSIIARAAIHPACIKKTHCDFFSNEITF